MYEVAMMIFQIGIIYAGIEAKRENKGGDQEKAKVGGFKFFKKKLMILKPHVKDAKVNKGGLSYVKKERTERFYID